ncbi:fluoride efflux transporter CrcB [Fischerella muscicola]|uniref:Fluoride-specific ion channel FluC n=1 Tax=Fischerella muscicola CCMEE 5323 TaxID=2019572 RepID=A0A2N6K822_FISMU|nr:fluoride efflux transporter CrcB [Fischerella muscicola CCMEE 5323]
MRFNLISFFQQIFQLLTVAPTLVPEVLQQPTVRNPIAVSLGAIAGALIRYYLSLWFAQQFGSSFPYGTFFINLSGCLVMGFFVTLTLEQIAVISPEVRLLVAVGFLGSYTTFSTYGFDSLMLLRTRNTEAAFFYWIGSAFLGIAFAQLGAVLARLLK